MSPAPVVIGGGLAGLTFAAALERAGIEVAVREERPALGGGAAITLWPNALAAFDAIGLGEAVRDLGEPAAAGVIRRHDGSLVRRLDPVASLRALGEPARVVDRGELQALLADRVSDIRVDTGVTDSAQLTELDGYVVGADGYRSVVARHLDPTLSETPAGYIAWRGVAPVPIDPGSAGVVWGARGEAGCVAMTGGRTYWFVTQTDADWRPDPDRWPAPFADLIAATPASAVLRHEMFDRSQPRKWFDERHVVIGDAAHAMQPGLGQGGCLAIEDAVVLAQMWADRGPGPATFAAFERRRRPRTFAALRASRRVGRLLHGRGVRIAATAARRTPTAVALRGVARFASREAGLRALTP